MHSLIEDYLEQENTWSDLTSSFGPDLKTLRWGAEHRVFKVGSHVYKIQLNNLKYDKHCVKYEFDLLSRLEGKAWQLHPEFIEINNQWNFLKIDYINGCSLSEIIERNELQSFPFVKLLLVVFKMSLSGVVHAQLRPRHIYVDEKKNVYVIDYGGSFVAKPLSALFSNFKIFKINNKNITFTSFLWILKVMTWDSFFKNNNKNMCCNNISQMENAKKRWMQNINEQNERRRNNELISNSIDTEKLDLFFDAENSGAEAINENESISIDYWTVELGAYVVKGHRCFGLLWDIIKDRVDFENKRVLDLFCNLGFVGLFSSIHGARSVVCADTSREVMCSAKLYTMALGIENVSYANLNNLNDTEAELCFSLSSRLDLDNAKQWDLLAKHKEIIYQTKNIASVEFERLEENNFKQYEIILTDFHGYNVIYAKK
jgi:tRNA A-37 threonylcarbamoyl transferase component Bud32